MNEDAAPEPDDEGAAVPLILPAISDYIEVILN